MILGLVIVEIDQPLMVMPSEEEALVEPLCRISKS